MRTVSFLALLPLVAATNGCSTLSGTNGEVIRPARDWHLIATDDDRSRLAGWRSSLVAALADARASGHGADVDREGMLLAPDLTPRVAALPNGRFACRVIKLGRRGGVGLGYVAYPAFTCRVAQEKELQGFAKLDGSQRPVGLVFPDAPTRQLFLGTLVLGDEQQAMVYGRDPSRDLAAWIEPVDGRRWRMVFPEPRFESRTDVIELVPLP